MVLIVIAQELHRYAAAAVHSSLLVSPPAVPNVALIGLYICPLTLSALPAAHCQ